MSSEKKSDDGIMSLFQFLRIGQSQSPLQPTFQIPFLTQYIPDKTEEEFRVRFQMELVDTLRRMGIPGDVPMIDEIVNTLNEQTQVKMWTGPGSFDEYYSPVKPVIRPLSPLDDDNRLMPKDVLDNILRYNRLTERELFGYPAVEDRPVDDDTAGIPDWQGSAARTILHRYSGVVVCECDDDECPHDLTITPEEYLQASGDGGWWRLTHPKCVSGVLGRTLRKRTEHYYVWS